MALTDQNFASPTRLSLAKSTRPAEAVIAIVLPIYNEENSIEAFMSAVEDTQAELAKRSCTLKYIFVNDGSQDGTLEKLIKIAAVNPQVHIIDLSRNFGKESALTAGIDYAVELEVHAVVPMDIDLQDPPELIVDMYEQWQQGFQLVLARRINRAADASIKAWAALAFYRVFNAVSHQKIPENVGDYRLMDRQVAQAIGHLNEKGRMMKALMNWVGFTRVYVDFTRPPRAKGRSSFNALSLFKLGLNGILSFSTAPLRAILLLGLSIGIFALIYGVFITVRTLLYGADVPGYASTLVIILIASALQITTLGIVGEYIARLFEEVKARPNFLISQRIDTNKAQDLLAQNDTP